jgi:hypothetical protein
MLPSFQIVSVTITYRAIWLIVFAADKSTDIILFLREKHCAWLISRADKFKRTRRNAKPNIHVTDKLG